MKRYYLYLYLISRNLADNFMHAPDTVGRVIDLFTKSKKVINELVKIPAGTTFQICTARSCPTSKCSPGSLPSRRRAW